MRMSKSFAALAFRTDALALEGATAPSTSAPRRRSSLDNLVIPGRTRIPSSRVSQPQPVDLKIAQKLLDAEARLPSRKTMDSRASDDLNPPKPRRPDAPLDEVENDDDSRADLPQDDRANFPDIVDSETENELDVDLHHSDANSIDEHLPRRRRSLRFGGSSEENAEFTGLPTWSDGPPYELPSQSSRTATSACDISHRDFTGSSSGSQRRGPGPSIEEYNRSAKEHGLEEFTDAPDYVVGGGVNSLVTASTTCVPHRSGWLSKKLDRTRSSWNLHGMAKAVRPELRRRKSGQIDPTGAPKPRTASMDRQTLEDLCRLGGMSLFELPAEFAAVDMFVLPSVVSASARHLVEHGCTAPGIFRLSGQATNVNALYHHFSSRYHNRSSVADPDRIQSTVGRGDLPSHLGYTLNDVASLLKKVLLGLPHGLLGSVKLFKAILSIHEKIRGEQAGADFVAFKARLIALAISCVTSDHRFYLICAVLGLAAVIGHESEKVISQKGSSDLMTYHALGVVLGPLLLGNDGNELIENESIAKEHAKTSASHKKERKHKRPSSAVAEDKLAQNPEQTIRCRVAESTGEVVEMLISQWKDVVKQLRDLAANAPESNESEQRLASRQSKYTLSASRNAFIRDNRPPHVVRVPSHSVMRGRLPSAHSKSSRSSRPSQGSRFSSGSQPREWFNEHCITDSSEGAPLLGPPEPKASKPRPLPSPRRYKGQGSNTHVRFDYESRTSSGQGSILHHGEDAPSIERSTLVHPFRNTNFTRNRRPLYETADESGNMLAARDHMADREAFSKRGTPQQEATALFGQPRSGTARSGPARSGKDAREFAPTELAVNGTESTRAGVNQQGPKALKIHYDNEYYEERRGNQQLLADSFGISRETGGIDADRGLIIANIGPRRSMNRSDDPFKDQSSNSAGRNNVKALAERFSLTSQGHYVPEDPEVTPTPQVYAHMYARPTNTEVAPPPVPEKDVPLNTYTGATGKRPSPPKVPEKDDRPALQHSKSDLGRGKESLIPKPVYEIGRARRKGESNSPSPDKEATPVKQARKPAYIPSTSPDTDDSDISYLAVSVAEGPSGLQKVTEDTEGSGSGSDMVSAGTQWTPRKPMIRKALTTSSMKEPSPLDALITGNRPASNSLSAAPGDYVLVERDRSPSMSQNSDTNSIRHLSPASRSNTITAQHAEIRRLNRELAKKTEHENQRRRSQDISRETASGRERSVSRDGSNYDDEGRKKVEYWKRMAAAEKRRADEAERKLAQDAGPALQKSTQVPEDAPQSMMKNVEAAQSPRKGTDDTARRQGDISEDEGQTLAQVPEVLSTPEMNPTASVRGQIQGKASEAAIKSLPPTTPVAERSPTKGPQENEQTSRKVSFATPPVREAPATPNSKSRKQSRATTPEGGNPSWRMY